MILTGSIILTMTAVGSLGCGSTTAQGFQGARHYAVGSRALDEGDAPRAILELERAARLVPHASEIQNHLGLAYWAEGREDEARNSFEQAVELDCDNVEARQNLGLLMRSLSSDANVDQSFGPAAENEHGPR